MFGVFFGDIFIFISFVFGVVRDEGWGREGREEKRGRRSFVFREEGILRER